MDALDDEVPLVDQTNFLVHKVPDVSDVWNLNPLLGDHWDPLPTDRGDGCDWWVLDHP